MWDLIVSFLIIAYLFTLYDTVSVISSSISFIIVISRFLGFNTFIWEQNCALPRGRRREGCRICHFLSWTDSIKPSLLYQTLDAVFPKDLFSDCLEITTAVIVPCGGPKSLPVHSYIVLWCLHFLVHWECWVQNFYFGTELCSIQG